MIVDLDDSAFSVDVRRRDAGRQASMVGLVVALDDFLGRGSEIQVTSRSNQSIDSRLQRPVER